MVPLINPEDEKKICNCIQWLIPTLKPEYAEIITLDLKEMDSGDIADQLGIKKDNLKVRRHRAREQLKMRIEETCKICAKHGCLDCDCKNQNR